MNPIQLFKPYFRKEEILQEIGECLDKGWTGMGYKTLEFENKWCDYTGLPHSHFLSSNTVGLHLAIKILKEENGWNDGDEIITTPLTFVSTNHAILYENLTPVFSDVDEYLCLDPESVLDRITNRTKAVLFVGIGGNPGNLNKIEEICRQKDLKLILDAAHMAGTMVEFDNHYRHIGHDADATIFSFQAVKNLPTADAGMICFRDSKYDKLSREYSWLGINKDTFSRINKSGKYSWKYDVPNLGYKYHGNSIMASIGLVQLKYLDSDNDKRNELCHLYESRLKELDYLNIIQNSSYCYKSSRHLFQVSVNDNDSITREKVMDFLNSENIFLGVHYIDNTSYKVYSNYSSDCPNARYYSNRILSLPLHLHLKNEDVERVCTALGKVE